MPQDFVTPITFAWSLGGSLSEAIRHSAGISSAVHVSFICLCLRYHQIASSGIEPSDRIIGVLLGYTYEVVARFSF
jgi:hypothetical protein